MSAAGGLSQEEAFARIRLLRSSNLGPITYRHLLARFGSALDAVATLPELPDRASRACVLADERSIQKEIASARKAGVRYLFHDSPEYPFLLDQSPASPPILTYRGDLSVLARPCVAMVGARNASAAAMRLAREIAHDLAGEGWTIVSGLARGIDGAAHQGALTAGSTVGVIASGIDIAYPPQHAALQEEVATRGLLLAEQPLGAEPLARHFPARNRIIAGLSLGTVVVEAAPKSGSLITARLANDMGRHVMAIPGSPLDPRSHGCNHLIREGATLVQDAADVLELLDASAGTARSDGAETGGDAAADTAIESFAVPGEEVLSLLTMTPVGVDELIRQSGAAAAAVQLALVELELDGRLARHAGGRVSLA